MLSKPSSMVILTHKVCLPRLEGCVNREKRLLLCNKSMLECCAIVPGSLKQVEEEEKRVLMEADDSDDSIDAGLRKVPHNVIKIKYLLPG